MGLLWEYNLEYNIVFYGNNMGYYWECFENENGNAKRRRNKPINDHENEFIDDKKRMGLGMKNC